MNSNNDSDSELNNAIIELANLAIDGTSDEHRRATERVNELRAARAQVRALATELALERRYRSTVKLFTPHGTLTHAITGEAIRPATAREQVAFDRARADGKSCILIAHVHDGQTWEEPYVITDTKTIEARAERDSAR